MRAGSAGATLTLTLSRMTRGPLTPVTVRYSMDGTWAVAVSDGAACRGRGRRGKRAKGARARKVAGRIKQRGGRNEATGRAPSRGPCTRSLVAAAACSCTLAKSSSRPITDRPARLARPSRLGLWTRPRNIISARKSPLESERAAPRFEYRAEHAAISTSVRARGEDG